MAIPVNMVWEQRLNDKARFNYRVAGIALESDRVLLHRAEIDDFWSLPGGRVSMGETAEEALIREMREEIGVEVIAERLLWVVENFFEYDGTPFHELGLYFLMTLRRESGRYDVKHFEGVESCYAPLGRDLRLYFKWQPLECLDDITLKPEFLHGALRSIPDCLQHTVHRD